MGRIGRSSSTDAVLADIAQRPRIRSTASIPRSPAIREHYHKNVNYISDKEQLTDAVASTIQSGDLVLTLGAGDVTTWNDDLVAKWRRRVAAGVVS
jgi:UDP-N-acetylmuramate-alanine ligase